VTTLDNATKAEICEGIVAQLEKHGHCTGYYRDDAGQMCLMGAGFAYLRRVNMSHHWSGTIAEALGFKTEDEVVCLNDGKAMITDYDRYFIAHPTVVDRGNPLDKDTAIEFATRMAKHWREQG